MARRYQGTRSDVKRIVLHQFDRNFCTGKEDNHELVWGQSIFTVTNRTPPLFVVRKCNKKVPDITIMVI